MKRTGPYWQILARNCEVRRIDKALSAPFLNSFHRLGDTACRYRYGLFIQKCGSDEYPVGTLVAVAGFSGARKWVKGGRTVRSCEWVRFASLPDIRIAGGMGKLLKAFISEVHPDDVMSYAPASWSDGDVYRKLGFIYEGDVSVAGGTAVNHKFRLILDGR